MEKTKTLPLLNKRLLMVRDASEFSVVELNEYSHDDIQPVQSEATRELNVMKQKLRNELVEIEEVDMPDGCQDAIYTANWGLVSGDTVIASRLPGPRKAEEYHARKIFRDLGMRVIVPPWQRFSGQGDALPVDDLLFMGHGYRSDDMESFFRRRDIRKAGFNYQLVNLQTKPLPSPDGRPVLNKLSGWPDSYYYDLDLALTILQPSIGDKAPLIGWCPEAFMPESQEKILKLWGRGALRLIEVTESEAINGIACNAVSTGHAVVMSNRAPEFQAKIEAEGLRTIPVIMTETNKGGGGPRCVSNDISKRAA